MHDDREDFISERRRRLAALKADDPVWEAAREFFDRTLPLQYSYNFDWMGVPIIAWPCKSSVGGFSPI
jgi:cephalosporin hydroxylase